MASPAEKISTLFHTRNDCCMSACKDVICSFYSMVGDYSQTVGAEQTLSPLFHTIDSSNDRHLKSSASYFLIDSIFKIKFNTQ